jgi:divalent metal cation (Fe/Co/Zn/Cd) transporter
MNMRSRTSQSLRTVIFALAANLGTALAKLLAALFTRSSAMLAEAFHAFADSGNEVLLLVAERRSSRSPDAQHPLGHGRAAYFWALIASLGVFASETPLPLPGSRFMRPPDRPFQTGSPPS